MLLSELREEVMLFSDATVSSYPPFIPVVHHTSYRGAVETLHQRRVALAVVTVVTLL